MNNKSKRKEAISYNLIKEIILSCKVERTQALLAFQYCLGARVGELAKKYKHVYIVDGEKNYVITKGIKRTDINLTEDMIRINKPNFKQKKRSLEDMDYNRGFVSKKNEEWLYNIIYDWLDKHREEYVFDIEQSRICELIDKELKKYDPKYSTHWIRHARASHIGELTADPMAVKDILGHGSVDTSMQYVHYSEALLRRRLGNDSFEKVLGKSLDD
jgi:site-specific recombinase XerD